MESFLSAAEFLCWRAEVFICVSAAVRLHAVTPNHLTYTKTQFPFTVGAQKRCQLMVQKDLDSHEHLRSDLFPERIPEHSPALKLSYSHRHVLHQLLFITSVLTSLQEVQTLNQQFFYIYIFAEGKRDLNKTSCSLGCYMGTYKCENHQLHSDMTWCQ